LHFLEYETHTGIVDVLSASKLASTWSPTSRNKTQNVSYTVKTAWSFWCGP